MTIKSNGNALVKKVVNVILDQGDTDNMQSFMKDVVSHGCSSGIVGELIYYTDTVAFYNKYKKEIQSLLREQIAEFGYKSPSQMFRQWDEEDTFAEEDQNRNLLAWYAFEQTCNDILNQLDIEY